MEESKYLKRLRERVESGHSRLFLSLAEELWKQGRDEEALSVMQKGVAEDPSFAQARAILGKRYADRALFAQAEMELSAAAALYDGMLAEKPDDEILNRTKEELHSLLVKVERARMLENFLEEVQSRFGGEQAGGV